MDQASPFYYTCLSKSIPPPIVEFLILKEIFFKKCQFTLNTIFQIANSNLMFQFLGKVIDHVYHTCLSKAKPSPVVEF